ncbi:MAG TPA: hypothetical protein VF823_10545 [Anaerolineales bacterium]
MTELSAEGLSALAGILLSLGCSYLPGVRQRFGELDATGKRLVMLGLLAVSALGVFGLSCTPYQPFPELSCDQAGAWGMLRLFLAALVANQAAFNVSPRLPGLKSRAITQVKRRITRRRRSPVAATFAPQNQSIEQGKTRPEEASPSGLAPQPADRAAGSGGPTAGASVLEDRAASEAAEKKEGS